MNIEQILKEIKERPLLDEKETEQLISFLNKKGINEGDAGIINGLNNAAFSVRKKNFKILRRIKIVIELILENVELKEKLEKAREAITDND